MARLIPTAFLALMPGVLAPMAFGQSKMYEFLGPTVSSGYGNSVSGAGDVNGDGLADLLVGPEGRVFSGADGGLLWGDGNGIAVSDVGDVDGDGVDDVIFGNYLANPNGQDSGSAWVLSGTDGSTIYQFDGDSAGDYLGYSVSGAGDVNADGVPDMIVGIRMDDDSGTNSGSARVFSGIDGSVLYTFHGDSADDLFGHSVAGAGDVDGDGVDDVIVGARGSRSSRVYSGRDGSVLYDFLGYMVAGAGDIHKDGFDDLVIGDPEYNNFDGRAWVRSGRDGHVIYSFMGPDRDRMGSSVDGAGDVNADGFPDVLVGAYRALSQGQRTGSTLVISGEDGSVIYILDGEFAFEEFGRSVSRAGDVNGDGFDDVIVGSPAGHGRGRVFSGCGTATAAFRYCTPAVVNSSGLPASMHACGTRTVSDNYFVLRATDLPLNQFGYFVASETQGFVPNPGGSQGNLCLGGTIARFRKQIRSSGTEGRFHIQVDLTSIPTSPPQAVLAGETWRFQAWFRDKNPNHTSNFTDGIRVLFN